MFSNPQELRERAMRAQQGKKDDTTSLESKPSAEEASAQIILD
ncbi:unnamed protein product [Ectocarpus sp. CCAP 1310/34]|nr:unnamed protein product [Ectocarpus sp. CCAP 1310/34]